MRTLFRFLAFVAAMISVTVIWATSAGLVARDLRFDERVEAQEAIERVYYSHQTGASLPFDEAVPRALLEAKVRDYLGKSAALEHSPGGAITTQKLQQEQERIESRSQTPDRLEEIYAALGNDPVLIQECFVRPALVDRLSQMLPVPLQSDNGTVRLDVEPSAPVPGCTVDFWETMSTVSAPPLVRYPPAAAGNYLAAVWTGNVLLVWGADALGNALGGRYNPLTDSWSPISTLGGPSARISPSAVWTGHYMVIWGGQDQNSGGRYDPIADSWLPTSLVSAPAGRSFHTAVWTGNVMIVWGGAAGGLTAIDTGSRYDPESDTWTATTQLNAPSARFWQTAIWTGSRMIIWGGESGTPLNTGGQYDPAADQWTPTTLTGSPTSRYFHTAVWTGSEMIVWGGFNDFSQQYFNTGGRYDPVADTWTPTSTGLAPTARSLHVAVWDGIRMIIWGGSPNLLSRGGRYDPATDTWTNVTTTNQPAAPDRTYAVAAWTGQQMLIWGGENRTDGGRYFGDTATLDLDLDGFTACDGDCNDADATVHPGASETCNGVDEDCDGAVDQGLSVVLTPNLLRPANHKMINIVASVEARDACGSALPFVLTSITSSEPDDIPGSSDGSTVNDIQGASFGTSDTAFQLRAERDRLGSGRIYTVRYTTTGSAGQQSSAEATARVP